MPCQTDALTQAMAYQHRGALLITITLDGLIAVAHSLVAVVILVLIKQNCAHFKQKKILPQLSVNFTTWFNGKEIGTRNINFEVGSVKSFNGAQIKLVDVGIRSNVNKRLVCHSKVYHLRPGFSLPRDIIWIDIKIMIMKATLTVLLISLHTGYVMFLELFRAIP